MRSFDDIRQIAIERKGAEEINAITPALPASDIAAIPDDRWLAAMTKRVFQAGFNWKVIEAKWDGFEAAFDGFDPARVGFYHDEDLDRLISDTRIVRHGTKIRSVIDNAHFVQDIARDHGSFGKFVADWPSTDFIGLMAVLKKQGARLGGNTGTYMLRFQGKDSFILSRDVVARLIAEGVVDKAPSSKRDLAATQAAFNEWMDQSGRGLTEISRTLALSL